MVHCKKHNQASFQLITSILGLNSFSLYQIQSLTIQHSGRNLSQMQ